MPQIFATMDEFIYNGVDSLKQLKTMINFETVAVDWGLERSTLEKYVRGMEVYGRSQEKMGGQIDLACVILQSFVSQIIPTTPSTTTTTTTTTTPAPSGNGTTPEPPTEPTTQSSTTPRGGGGGGGLAII